MPFAILIPGLATLVYLFMFFTVLYNLNIIFMFIALVFNSYLGKSYNTEVFRFDLSIFPKNKCFIAQN